MNTIYTIGHSNHPLDRFLSNLSAYNVRTVVDVRTRPTSRFPHFRQRALKEALSQTGIEYLFYGEELGGHPKNKEFYDASNHVIYERVAATPSFRRGIKNLITLSSNTTAALLCAEGDPAKCHRHPLISRYLLERGLEVLHIKVDGTVEDAKSMFSQPTDSQIPLFEPPGEDLTWRSPKRIDRC